MFNCRSSQKNKGFSLIELMVAITLFSFVAVAGVSAMIAVIDGNEKTNSLVDSMSNLSFALESIARELRVGSMYNCSANPNRASTNNCASATKLGFISSENEYIVYNFNSGNGSIERCKSGVAGNSCAAPFVAMTGQNITVNDLGFYVSGSSNADTEQPRVTIIVSGTAGDDPDTDSTFVIQTTVTQRFPDF